MQVAIILITVCPNVYRINTINGSFNQLFIFYFWFTTAQYIIETWFNNHVGAFGDRLRLISVATRLPFEDSFEEF